MRTPLRLGLGLLLSALAPAAAFAGGPSPTVVRAGMGLPAAPGARAIRVAPRPVYGPPTHAIYGPPRQARRHAGRHGLDAGLFGYPFVYPSVAEQAPAPAPVVASGEYLRPRAAVIYNYAGGPPLAQGDPGYVAQPAIYNVKSVLRRYPLTGVEPHGR